MLRIAALAAFVGLAQAIECPVPPLPYSYNALEPSIGEDTMRTHHDKHHVSYAKKFCELLNSVENDSSSANHASLRSIIDKGHLAVLKNIPSFPANMQGPLIAQGGGYVNHKAFWEIMRKPRKNNAPTGTLEAAINKQFGSFTAFKDQFSKTAENIFGSGWAWLVVNKQGGLEILTTSNQDTPVRDGACVVLLLDVWEHAYYLDYKNVRADYVSKWWDVVDWDRAEAWYKNCLSGAGNRDEL